MLTGFVYGEGGSDRKFLSNLIRHEKFRFHTLNWRFTVDNASGESPKTVLEKCSKLIQSIDYDIVTCHIDLDVLQRNSPKDWKVEKQNLEDKFNRINIFWHENSLEDEMRKVLGKSTYKKKQINNFANENIPLFINSSYWTRFIEMIRQREDALGALNTVNNN